MTDFLSKSKLDEIITIALKDVDTATFKRTIVGTVDDKGAGVVVSFKFRDDRWTLQATAQHEWAGDNTVGAKVLIKW